MARSTSEHSLGGRRWGKRQTTQLLGENWKSYKLHVSILWPLAARSWLQPGFSRLQSGTPLACRAFTTKCPSAGQLWKGGRESRSNSLQRRLPLTDSSGASGLSLHHPQAPGLTSHLDLLLDLAAWGSRDRRRGSCTREGTCRQPSHPRSPLKGGAGQHISESPTVHFLAAYTTGALKFFSLPSAPLISAGWRDRTGKQATSGSTAPSGNLVVFKVMLFKMLQN